ncbi:BCCT family transporter [Spiribacter curvatus]|uniref:BCCT family transporter n=1 Tax=Spiribacter curvatus TaxID=1335757 RepID=UPI0004047F3C|nr:BCCT family transporter [Spiribacter curvatus]
MSIDNDQRRTQAPPASNIGETFGDPWVLGLSAGFILLFVGLSIFDVDLVSQLVGSGFAWTAKYLGSYFQLLLLLTFVIALGVAISPAGGAVMGDLDKPEMSTFRWLAIIMCPCSPAVACSRRRRTGLSLHRPTPPAFEPRPARSRPSAGRSRSRSCTGAFSPGRCSAG